MKAKKIMALLLASTMAFSLAACGGSSSGTSGSAAAEEDASDDEEDEDDAEDEDSADAEASEDEESYDELLADVIPEETVTLDVFDQLANYSGEQIGWFAQVMLEKFNVKLNIIQDADGVYETRMESGNLGDLVIWGNDSDEYLQAIDKGLLYDWNEDDLLDEYGPYIKEHMPAALEKTPPSPAARPMASALMLPSMQRRVRK